MRKLTIGIDIDGTITDPFYWLDFANRHFGRNLRPEDITVYEIGEVLNVKKEEYMNFYELHKMEIHKDAGVQEDAKEVVSKIFKEHRGYYVTARDQTLYDLTMSWLRENHFPTKNLHTIGSHHKVEKAKELGCELFLEDRYENALELAKAGITVILIDCIYNRLPLKENMIRVHSWKEVERVIEGYALEEKYSSRPLRVAEEMG